MPAALSRALLRREPEAKRSMDRPTDCCACDIPVAGELVVLWMLTTVLPSKSVCRFLLPTKYSYQSDPSQKKSLSHFSRAEVRRGKEHSFFRRESLTSPLLACIQHGQERLVREISKGHSLVRRTSVVWSRTWISVSPRGRIDPQSRIRPKNPLTRISKPSWPRFSKHRILAAHNRCSLRLGFVEKSVVGPRVSHFFAWQRRRSRRCLFYRRCSRMRPGGQPCCLRAALAATAASNS